ncbi:uncharacterized protein LOC114516661 [Dendronephthya gigantea]|uniref:uncharacterized protein LOC114516661 n=1 Tax=Dendronephthya gigantea TaxID=151771 RepID=UPI00106D8C16|nr:uncharacterized protein LOC114516661 [Dendronephthya gigantea]
MFPSGKFPSYFFKVGLLLGLTSRSVKCSAKYVCPEENKGSSCNAQDRYEFFYNESTWEEAKEICSKRNGTLVDFSDEQDLSCVDKTNSSDKNIWIGLTKTNASVAKKRINYYSFEIGLCECANISGHLKNSSCTGDAFPSICSKKQDKCDNGWKRNGSHCYLPVYDLMTWYGALAHCRRLNSTLYEGNASKDILCNASLEKYFWTRNLYKINMNESIQWKLVGGRSYKQNKWRIPDMRCGVCGFWENGVVYLITPNCSQNFSYLCRNDSRANLTSNNPPLSRKSVNASCLLRIYPNESIVQENVSSYWLGIYSKNTCSSRLVKNLQNETDELKLITCSYVSRNSDKTSNADCDNKNHVICVKSARCDPGWKKYNEHCYKVRRSQNLTWREAERTCGRFGSRLLRIDDDDERRFISGLVNNSRMNSSWIGLPCNIWRWVSDNTTANYTNWDSGQPENNSTKDCVYFVEGATEWENEACLSNHFYICEKEGTACQDNYNATWRRFGKSCYNLSVVQKTWSGAKTECQKLGGKLLKIDDENDLGKNISTCIVSMEKKFWIGLRRVKSIWTWIYDDSPHYYNKSNEPKYERQNSRCSSHFENYICKKSAQLSGCPNDWRNQNGSCIRAFNNVRTKWKYANAFCRSRHGSHLANLSDIKRINASQYLDYGKRYWINNASIQCYSSRDPLDGWRWIDGEQFNDSNRRGLYTGRLKYTGDNRRCAVLHVSNNGTMWQDHSCLTKQSFICKNNSKVIVPGTGENSKGINPSATRNFESSYTSVSSVGKEISGGNSTAQGKIIAVVKELLRFKPNTSEIKDAMKEVPKNPNLEEKLADVNTEVIGIVNSSFNLNFNATIEENVLEVKVSTKSLKELRQRNNITMPILTIEENCSKQSNCTIKIIEIQFNGVVVNSSHLSNNSLQEFSNISMLDYIVRANVISELEPNETVSLNFREKRSTVLKKDVECAYLDKVQWSKKGMKLHSVDENNVHCQADHLSSFTMIVLGAEVDDTNSRALLSIFYIGCTLSLTGLVFSCVVYILLRKDLKILTTTRLLVHFNLLIALGLTQIGFLAGGRTTTDGVPCKIVAIFLHYFTFAGFTWILLEVTLLYLKLISVYSGEFVRMKYFYLFGWGFPLIFVGLSAGLNYDVYGNDTWCWISYEDGFKWLIFAPVIIMTSITFLAVVGVARVLLVVSKSEGADNMRRIISAARGVLVLFPTLGLCWVFGIIGVNHDALVWKYLFAISSSIQGFLIFMIYGVCNTEIRSAIARKMGFDVHPATSMSERRS